MASPLKTVYIKVMKRIIFFDGVCPLCNGFVDFVLKKDSKKLFLYSSLQSSYAQAHLPIQHQGLDSIVLSENGVVYTKSTAILRILFQLGGHYNALSVFASIIPRPVRDMIYNFIAHNRYRWFGKFESCRLATVEEKNLFIE